MNDFQLISHDQAARTDVYCDTGHHITVTHPVNQHSGLPAAVALTDCNCAQSHIVPAEQLPASDLATIHPDLVPEATGEPELSNAAVEGDDVPPATPAELEKLGQ